MSESGQEDLAFAVYRDVFDTRVTNYVAFVGYSILVWDHIITFSDEVRYIWHGRKTFVIYLFFFNRYFTPFAFIGNFVAYFSSWSAEHCNNFVMYEGALTAIGVWVSGLMMLMRVKALYTDRPNVIRALIALLLAEAGVFIWLLTRGEAVQHTAAVTACTMIFDPDLRFPPSLSAWFPLVYDTIVIILTLYRCAGPARQKTASHIVLTLMRDGLLYYSVIFGVNLVLAIMIVFARDGIKNITAQLELLLTVAMMSRITLSLRRKALKDPSSEEDTYLYPRNTPLQSFHAYNAHQLRYDDVDWDKWSEDWSIHAGRDPRHSSSRNFGASSPWSSPRHHDRFAFSRGSFDSDPVIHPETQSGVSRPTTAVQEEFPLQDWHDENESVIERGRGRDASGAVEHCLIREPEQAVVSGQRSGHGFEGMSSSTFIR